MLRDRENHYRGILRNMGFKEVINSYTIPKRDIELQGLGKEEYLSTREGFIPLCPETPWLPLMKVARKNLPLPIKMFAISPVPFKQHHLSIGILSFEDASQDYSTMIENVTNVSSTNVKYLKTDAASSLRSAGGWKDVFYRSERIGSRGFIPSEVLVNYSIDEPLFVLNIDLVSLISLKQGMSKEEVLYPHPSLEFSFSDKEIAETMGVKDYPKTAMGKLISRKTKREVLNMSRGGLKKAKLFSYEVPERGVITGWITNAREGGAIASEVFDEFYIWDKNLYLIPRFSGGGAIREVREKGAPTGLTLLDALADKVAFEAESLSEWRKSIGFRSIKSPEEANVCLPGNVRSILSPIDFEVDLDLDVVIEVV